MWKAWSMVWVACLPVLAWADARLTPLENQWLAAGAPVIAYAHQLHLPLDVVVQPNDQPGRAPLAMGFVDGRCKLVFSMRGNPAAEDTLKGLAPELVTPVIEAVTAHEVGHCWRYVQGAWRTLPAGFEAAAPTPTGAGMPDDLQHDLRHMHDQRREEAFADLVGLAWAQNRHPEQYARVHAWFTRVRADPQGGGSNGHHDTGAWVRLVREPSAFGDGVTPFDQVIALWRRGVAETLSDARD